MDEIAMQMSTLTMREQTGGSGIEQENAF
jgi:hypothetical protein